MAGGRGGGKVARGAVSPVLSGRLPTPGCLGTKLLGTAQSQGTKGDLVQPVTVTVSFLRVFYLSESPRKEMPLPAPIYPAQFSELEFDQEYDATPRRDSLCFFITRSPKWCL